MRSVRRPDADFKMRCSIVLAIGLMMGTDAAVGQTSQSPTFREAASEAQSVVRVSVTGGDQEAATFTVVEIVRGQEVPKKILVSSELWSVHRPKPVPTGD